MYFFVIKVKGLSYSELVQNHTLANLSAERQAMYERIWDEADYVIPPSENNAFFVMTNIVITPNQTRSKCPEDHFEIPKIACSPHNNSAATKTATESTSSNFRSNISYNHNQHLDDTKNQALFDKDSNDNQQNKCIKGRIYNHKSHGKETGNCIMSDRVHHSDDSVYVCEISGWCPVELDVLAMEDTPLIQGTEKFTVLIKNAISFPWFGEYRRNNMPNGICMFKPNKESTWLCPIFRLGDIVELAGGTQNTKRFSDL